MNEYQKIQAFNDITQCSVEQATRFLRQNNYNVDAAINAFLESGEESGNLPPVVIPQPSELAMKQMMESTSTSREQANRFLKNNFNNIQYAINKFLESGEEPRGNPKNTVGKHMDAYLEQGHQAENAVPIEIPQPSELAIKEMMESTSTSKEQAIRYLQNCFNSVPEAINKFIDSGEEPRGYNQTE
ncbi:UBA-like_superfamily [Hexamita inflata]|uniref:UBA-like superfamily n=1 Tax=Hexamita inflata TaxID=28002 RepID=A0AA86PS87_9EUKA|nr:UBA-like superfamily [Hexamita inflata]